MNRHYVVRWFDDKNKPCMDGPFTWDKAWELFKKCFHRKLRVGIYSA